MVEKSDVRDGRDLAVGDALVGIASSGLHSYGHSLARKQMSDDALARAVVALREMFAAQAVDGSVRFPAAAWLVLARSR